MSDIGHESGQTDLPFVDDEIVMTGSKEISRPGQELFVLLSGLHINHCGNEILVRL